MKPKLTHTEFVDKERIGSLERERLEPLLHECKLILVVVNLSAEIYICFPLSIVPKIPKNISSTLMIALWK